MNMFPSRRKEARNRRIRIALCLTAMVLAILTLAAWLGIRYYLSGIASQPPENSEPSSLPEEPLPAETATSLLILGDRGEEQFLLVQFAPADGRAYVAPLPTTMDDGSGQSLSSLLQKSGAPRVKSAVQAMLQLPLSHYVTVTAKGVEDYMNYLEGGLTMTLPEAVNTTDTSGLTVRLNAGQRQLTAAQIAVLLRYDGWSSAAVRSRFAADLVATVLNQYLQPGHRFDGDFAALANVIQSDIRIDHYNAYRTALHGLADSNTGELACVLSLAGKTEQGLWRPDVAAIRAQTPLYANRQGE